MVGRVRASTALLQVEQLVQRAVVSMEAEAEAVHMVVAVAIANSLLQIRRAEDFSSALWFYDNSIMSICFPKICQPGDDLSNHPYSIGMRQFFSSLSHGLH